MALVYPNTPANYKAFFKELATTHNNIRHNDATRKNFSIISLESAMKGFTTLDIKQFESISSTQKTMKKGTEENCGMVIVQMDSEQPEADIKVNQKYTMASFCIYTKPVNQDFDARDAALNTCYVTANEIMAAIKQFFDLNYLMGKILMINDEAAYIAKDNLVGWRFDFKYRSVKTLCHNDGSFTGLDITTLP